MNLKTFQIEIAFSETYIEGLIASCSCEKRNNKDLSQQ